MTNHFQKVEAVQSELTNMGYVFPLALRWTNDDVDFALERLKLLVEWDKQAKFELLQEFFEQNEQGIVQFINERLKNFIEEKNEI
jgi:hypothetical protein